MRLDALLKPRSVAVLGASERPSIGKMIIESLDTVGFTNKTWLDQMAHPNTEQLHLIERYKRVDANTLELDLTIDDPGAYTKPWNGHRNFTTSKTGFLRYQQICSTRENQRFLDNLGKPAIPAAK